MLEAPDPASRRSTKENERDLHRKIEGIVASHPDPTSLYGERPRQLEHHQRHFVRPDQPAGHRQRQERV